MTRSTMTPNTSVDSMLFFDTFSTFLTNRPNPSERSKLKGTGRDCYTCRIRRKKCGEKRDQNGSCQTCVHLSIECSGFGLKRPDWLRKKSNVLVSRETSSSSSHLRG
ncbi:hypothetical protein C8J56DRAFT_929553 [Mycena floridula]|nr:hypothetical protein C8J56DRAFT_929553 [Mycena floridula]